MKNYLAVLTVFLLIAVSAGCSGGLPTAPEAGGALQISPSAPEPAGENNRISWGLWDITVDPVAMTADVVPLREGQIHYNVLQMLEGWACKKCVMVESLDWKDKHTLVVDISIRHPYPYNRLDLTGRDVRGIAIFEGTTPFPYHTVRNQNGVETPLLASRRLLNADGYTTHFNRWTAEEGWDLIDYRRGRFAPASELYIKGNLHPFKYFYTHEYKRLFYPGYTVTRTYELKIDKYETFSFAYSVDASWHMPLKWPVINPILDFPISASAREAFQISMSIENNTLTRQGGSADLLIDIFDHQGYETISTVTLEAPDLFKGIMSIDPAAPIYTELEMARYKVTIPNEDGHAKTADGGSDLLVVVEDVDMSVVGEDVRAYEIFKLPVADPPYSWRPRNGTFLDRPFPGPPPSGQKNVDMTVIANPQGPWAFNAGEPMLVFNSDSEEKFLACNRDFTDWFWLAGYAGVSPSFLLPVMKLDAAAGGAFGLVSASSKAVSSPYLIKHSTNMHAAGGIYLWSWFTGSMDDPQPHLEVARDVSGGFGQAGGDPIYAAYVFDPSGPGPAPAYTSLHRIEYPYNDYGGILRAFVPQMQGLTGTMPPFVYGVSYDFLVAIGVDDDPVTTSNPYTVYLYTAENRHVNPTANQREMDMWEINFSNPASPKRIRTYSHSFLGSSLFSPIGGDEARLIDVDVLPALTNNVYMGDGKFAKNNWVVVLYTFESWGRWFVEIFDPSPDDPGNLNWNKPIYFAGPYKGVAVSMDVDPVNFEIYVLHNDSVSATPDYHLTCLEYY